MNIYSPEFTEGGSIPPKFTCDEDRARSPRLVIENVPENAASLALIVDDPDVPTALIPSGIFTHWVLFNLPPATPEIPESGSAGTPGANSAGQNAYTGPCPPPEYEPSEHRYFFRLYALDTMLALPEGASAHDVETAMTGHVIEKAECMGRYKRR